MIIDNTRDFELVIVIASVQQHLGTSLLSCKEQSQLVLNSTISDLVRMFTLKFPLQRCKLYIKQVGHMVNLIIKVGQVDI